MLAALDGAVVTGPGLEHAGAPVSWRRPALLVAGALLSLAAAGAAWQRRTAPPDVAGPLMLAVLPFEHAGPAEQAVFTDGLTDAVTAKLGALPGLNVIDRRSVAPYGANTKPARQIGAELGVRYLVQGVVRWARDGAGAWRAQVTPTLVDAKTGTTKWTGASVIVTPTDPFTAQGDIATDVARALEIQLRPVDAAALRQRATDNPEAFAAYTRGRQIVNAAGFFGSAESWSRTAAEFERAVGLDSTYGDAWAHLADASHGVANWSPGDRAAEARMRRVVSNALVHAPDHPMLLTALAGQRLLFDRDTSGVDALIRRAASSPRSDAHALSASANLLALRGDPVGAFALYRRAVALDPRSVTTHVGAANAAAMLRRWADVQRETDAAIALDSTDEQPWLVRLSAGRKRGDTLSMQLDAALALRLVRVPTPALLGTSAYARGPYAERFLALTPQALDAVTVYDSASVYFDTKADILTQRRDAAGARVYYDSIRVSLARMKGRDVVGFFGTGLLAQRALAEAALGDTAAARRTLAEVLEAARQTATRRDLFDVLDETTMAAIYARLGEPDTAVRWLEAGLAAPFGWTGRGYAVEPRLQVLRGTAAFERFLRAHPE